MTNDGWGKPAAPWLTTPAPEAPKPAERMNTVEPQPWGVPAVVNPAPAPAWGEPVTFPPADDWPQATPPGWDKDGSVEPEPKYERSDVWPYAKRIENASPVETFNPAKDSPQTQAQMAALFAAKGTPAQQVEAIAWAHGADFDNWGKPNVKPPATDYDYTPRDTKDDDTYPRFFEELATNEHGQRTRVAAYKFETEEHYNMALEAIEGEIREIPADEYVAHESYMKREDEWREGNFMGATLRSNAINAINRTETEFAVTEDGELEDVKDVIASGHKGEAVGFYIAYHNGKWLHAILSGPYLSKGDAYGIADTCYNKFINDEVFKRAFEGKFERSGVYCAELPLSAKRKGAYGVITNGSD